MERERERERERELVSDLLLHGLFSAYKCFLCLDVFCAPCNSQTCMAPSLYRTPQNVIERERERERVSEREREREEKRREERERSAGSRCGSPGDLFCHGSMEVSHVLTGSCSSCALITYLHMHLHTPIAHPCPMNIPEVIFGRMNIHTGSLSTDSTYS